MIIYVGYVLSDYAHALWISANKATVEKAIASYRKKGGRCLTQIKRYKITNELTELDCD